MKRFFLNVTLLLSSVSIPHMQLTAATCPCVSKEGVCQCAQRGGSCNCAEVYAREGSVPADCPCAKTDNSTTACCCTPQNNNPVVAVSYGELFDKVTILEIKQREIHDEQKRNHVITELEILNKSVDAILEKNSDKKEDLLKLKAELGEINWQLWRVEDLIREKEAAHLFDEGFIQLARNVYKLNNARIVLKTKISQLLNSHIIEVKSYVWHTVTH